MGQRELLEAIRREGEEQAAAIRRSADSEAERIRADAARRLDELRTLRAERCGRFSAAKRRHILAGAERSAALVRLQAEHGCAVRLREQTATLLALLRDDDYEPLFRRLAHELPDAEWATVRVNAADVALAAACFPSAVIETDPAITGGLEAATKDGLLTVVNTFETRLEQAWPELLPQMLAGLRP